MKTFYVVEGTDTIKVTDERDCISPDALRISSYPALFVALRIAEMGCAETGKIMDVTDVEDLLDVPAGL